MGRAKGDNKRKPPGPLGQTRTYSWWKNPAPLGMPQNVVLWSWQRQLWEGKTEDVWMCVCAERVVGFSFFFVCFFSLFYGVLDLLKRPWSKRPHVEFNDYRRSLLSVCLAYFGLLLYLVFSLIPASFLDKVEAWPMGLACFFKIIFGVWFILG